MIVLLFLLFLVVGCAGSHPEGGVTARAEGQQQTPALTLLPGESSAGEGLPIDRLASALKQVGQST